MLSLEESSDWILWVVILVAIIGFILLLIETFSSEGIGNIIDFGL